MSLECEGTPFRGPKHKISYHVASGPLFSRNSDPSCATTIPFRIRRAFGKIQLRLTFSVRLCKMLDGLGGYDLSERLALHGRVC